MILNIVNNYVYLVTTYKHAVVLTKIQYRILLKFI